MLILTPSREIIAPHPTTPRRPSLRDRLRPTDRHRPQTPQTKAMALGDWRLSPRGNVYVSGTTGNVMVEDSCPDKRPFCVTCTLSGMTLCGDVGSKGICVSPIACPSTFKYEWWNKNPPVWPADPSLDVSFNLAFGGTNSPPPKTCCEWTGGFEFDTPSGQYLSVGLTLNEFGCDVVGANFLVSFFGTLTRSGTSWVFSLVAGDSALGLTGIANPVFTGTVSSPNCMDPFTIANASANVCAPHSCNGVIATGGSASFVPFCTTDCT